MTIDATVVSDWTFFEQSPDACFLVDAAGILVEANLECECTFGCSRDELIGQHCTDLGFPRLQDKPWHKSQATFEIARKDGQRIHLDLRTRKIETGNGSLVMGSARQFTQPSLPQSDLLLRTVLDCLPQAVFWKDRSSRFLGANQTAAELVGMESPEALVGMSDSALFDSEEDARHCQQWDQRVMESDQAEYHIIEPTESPDGRTLWLDRTKIPLHSSQGDVVGVVVVIDDVTQRIDTEEENKRLQKQVQHAQKMEALGQLAAGVAHEFNNSLAAIRTNTEVALCSEPLSESVRQAFEEIERSCGRASTITRQLLSFARQKNSEVSVFDPQGVLTNCEPMFRRLLGGDTELKIHVPSTHHCVRANESQLEQALLNLILNARDATNGSGVVSIAMDEVTVPEDGHSPDCKPGQYVRISVQDNGCGMSEEALQRAFEPFFTTKPTGRGTGLGLWTVYSDLSNYDGFVTIESALGQGTTIHLHLPTASAPLSTQANTMPPGEIRTSDETILVCDDDEIVLLSICKLLTCFGFHVIGARSGKEALSMAKNAPDVALLLTDVSMPEMDGIQLATRINQLHPKAKIIYSSGYAADRVALGHVGDDSFWEKGGRSKLMVEQIRRVLDGK